MFSIVQELRDIWEELAGLEDDEAAIRLFVSSLAKMQDAFSSDEPETSRRIKELACEVLSFAAIFSAKKGAALEEERRTMRAGEAQLQHLHQQLLKKNMMLRERTMVDELTGLFNRRYFERSLAYDIERFRRYHRPIGIVLFDVDFFKKVNDTYGHAVGDAALRHLADLAKSTIRSADVVARYGGEEFVLLLPETDTKGALILADRLRRRVESSPLDTQDGTLSITISLGVFAVEGDFSGSADEAMRVVDNALYAAKEAGRNCIKTP